jgi:hypothetical protein
MLHVVQVGLVSPLVDCLTAQLHRRTGETSCARFSSLHENANHFQLGNNLQLHFAFSKKKYAETSQVNVGNIGSIKTIHNNICIMAEMEVICESGFRR